MPRDNPFGDEQPVPSGRVNPFGEDRSTGDVREAADRVEEAARRIRMLRTQMGAEGLTMAGTRSLIEELSGALDSAARALRTLEQRRSE